MLARVVNALPHRLSQGITKLYFQGLTRNQRPHSTQEYNSFRKMNVQILPALQDNYMYLIVDKITREAAVVDPVQPDVVLKTVQELGVRLTTVLTTHHHWDHAGGNEDLVRMVPGLKVYGADARIGALTNVVEHNTSFRVGELNICCLFTPCHTTGHICYYVSSPDDGSEPAVFTGDTLFLGGCGRFFEGTAEQMYTALIDILSKLPGNTKVYCGHEYTIQNLMFAAHVEPNNADVQKKIEWSIARRNQAKPTVPSTIAEEKLYNPFMRVTVPDVMQFAMKTTGVETMQYIRAQKDNFKAKY